MGSPGENRPQKRTKSTKEVVPPTFLCFFVPSVPLCGRLFRWAKGLHTTYRLCPMNPRFSFPWGMFRSVGQGVACDDSRFSSLSHTIHLSQSIRGCAHA